MNEAGKRYRRENAASITLAMLIGAFIGGLIGLITWAALIRKPPRPTALWFVIYIGVGLGAIFIAAGHLRRTLKKTRETGKTE